MLLLPAFQMPLWARDQIIFTMWDQKKFVVLFQFALGTCMCITIIFHLQLIKIKLFSVHLHPHTGKRG